MFPSHQSSTVEPPAEARTVLRPALTRWHRADRGPRVALVSFDFGQYCVRLASALASKAEVLLLLPADLARPHLDELAPEVSFRPFDNPRLREPLRQARTIRWMLRTVDEFEPDLVHFQHRHLWFNFALRMLDAYPLVVTIHDPESHLGDRAAQRVPQRVADLGYRRADQIIVHGEALREPVMRRLGVASESIHVIPMPELGCTPGDAAITENDGEVLFFGRIWEYKGLEYLLRAEPTITERVPGARIVIAGEGEEFGRYRKLMVNPEQFLVFNEFVSEERCSELFRRASVVVLPYVDASQSAIIPMAYSYGKPVVSTNVGALPEMVDDGHTGLLVPPRDAEALAGAVIKLLEDRELRHRMGRNARKWLRAECSLPRVAELTVEAYRQALEGRV